jgi:hypothetical protein
MLDQCLCLNVLILYRIMKRPENNEYAEFYAGYVSSIPETDVLGVMEKQPAELRTLLGESADDRGDFAYAEGKWTVKELIGHIIDGERVFGYRLHRFSHGDTEPLTGFDQNIYVTNGRSRIRAIADMLEEFDLTRRANLLLLSSLRESDWDLSGTASGAQVSVRALAFIMAGHVRHHANILRERYLA